MKNVILISLISVAGLSADAMTDMVTDTAMSKAKTEVRTQAVKQIAGDDAVKKDLVNKGADQVLGKENPVDKIKSDALGAAVGSKASTPDVGTMLGGKTKETSLEDKAIDMAAEKAVGSDMLKKEVAKGAIKSAF